MADFIDVLSPSAISDLEKANKLVLELASNVDKTGQKFKGFTMPSQTDDAVKSLNAEYQKQEKIIQSLQAKLQKATQSNEKNIQRQRLAEIKLSQDREKAFDKYEKSLQREQAKLQAAESMYGRIQNSLNLLQNSYRDLALRKELNGTLTSKEEANLSRLQTRIQTYDKALKAVDGSMGKYGRNVGNYASAFNPLSNSINQLAREAPAFANSMQTGFMAISNNLPIFFDAMGQVIAQNKELQAQGKPTQSVLSQIASSLFSFQTMLSVGVTLLTLYGKEIINWVSSLWGASEALDELNKRQNDFNNSKKEGRKDAQSDIIELKKYLSVVKDDKVSMEERTIALKALRSQYPFYFKNLSDAKILTGQYGKAEKELTTALEKRKEIERKTDINVINKQRLIDIQEELDVLNKSIPALKKTLDLRREQARGDYQFSGALANAEKNYSKALDNRNKLAKEFNAIRNAERKNDTDIFKLKKETIALEYQEEQTRKRILQIKREEVKVLGENLQSQEANFLLNSLEEQKKVLEEQQRILSKNNIEWRLYQKLIDGVDKSIKELTDTQNYLGDSGKKVADDLTKLGEKMKAQEEATRKMKEATDEWLKSIQSGFLEDAGLGSLNFFMKVQENGLTMYEQLMAGADSFADKFAITFKGVTDVAKEAFSFINQASEASFNKQLSDLDKQKEISLKYAGDSATAREEIEKKYEERRRAIERQRAEQEKKQAIFNVIINTAQAIASAVAKSPLTGGLPFSAIAAAIGAAQIAVISSAEIPNYEYGTDNHQGGLMLINDAKGSNYTEAVKTPDGKVTKYKGRNVLVNAPKGTEVLTAQETLQFDRDLNNLLMNNGISQNVAYNGIDKNDLDNVMGKYFRNIQVNNTTFDKDGITSFYMKNGQKTKTLDRVVTFKGFNV